MKRLTLTLLLAAACLTGCKYIKSSDGDTSSANNMIGIDISHHNKVNWEVFPSSGGIGFVYVKVTEGATFVDPCGKDYITQAKEKGLHVGAYHFLSTTSSAKRQFDNFMKHCCHGMTDLIPVLDFEQINGKNTKQLQDILTEFSSLCEKEFGTKPIIYTSPSLYDNIIYPNEGLREHIMFIGHPYLIKPNLKGNRESYIWQYFARGKVPGINGNVDLDRLIGLSLSDILLTE